MTARNLRRVMSLHVFLQASCALETVATLCAQVVPQFIVTLCVHLKSVCGETCLTTYMTHMALLKPLPKFCVNILVVIEKT